MLPNKTTQHTVKDPRRIVCSQRRARAIGQPFVRHALQRKGWDGLIAAKIPDNVGLAT